ncbi:hypothetical protein TSH64_08160 [Azospirillum sp. TSH64]|nr:hypothetical protein TSH64_08160 [Azospirillum sp. TSH64]
MQRAGNRKDQRIGPGADRLRRADVQARPAAQGLQTGPVGKIGDAVGEAGRFEHGAAVGVVNPDGIGALDLGGIFAQTGPMLQVAQLLQAAGLRHHGRRLVERHVRRPHRAADMVVDQPGHVLHQGEAALLGVLVIVIDPVGRVARQCGQHDDHHQRAP